MNVFNLKLLPNYCNTDSYKTSFLPTAINKKICYLTKLNRELHINKQFTYPFSSGLKAQLPPGSHEKII